MKKNKLTPCEKIVNKLFVENRDMMIELYSRWQIEKDHCTFDVYADCMKKEAEKTIGIRFVKATRRPFGFIFIAEHQHFSFAVRKKGRNINAKVKNY